MRKITIILFFIIYNISLTCHAVTLVTLKTKVPHGSLLQKYFEKCVTLRDSVTQNPPCKTTKSQINIYLLFFKYLFYSNTYFIQILILFQYLFYSNTYFIQILIYYFIQILNRGGFDGYVYGQLMRVGRNGRNLALLFTNFSNLLLYARLHHFWGRISSISSTSLLFSIEYNILFSPCKNNNNNNNITYVTSSTRRKNKS